MKARYILPLLTALAGAFAPGYADARSANAAPAPAIPGRLEPVPLAGLSIMLSPEERRAIQAVLSGEKPPAEMLEQKKPQQSEEAIAAPKTPLPLVYLSGISYIGPGQWSIWLNNRRIESAAPDEEFKVTDIASRAVRIEWAPKDRGETHTFVLRPRQTFDPSQRAVLEGDHRRGLALKQDAAAK